MLLSPTSLLHIDGGPKVRLSYIFEDDAGCRKGLTVARILPGDKPHSFGIRRELNERFEVFAGDVGVGLLDPHLSSDDEVVEMASRKNRLMLGSGALTCTFTLHDGTEIDPDLGPRQLLDAVRFDHLEGLPAFVLGDGHVGAMSRELIYLEWGHQSIYPLLRLRRSDLDLAAESDRTRNGATITTSDGRLVGFVVALFGNASHYAVAPIRDTLNWHRLRLLPAREGFVHQPGNGSATPIAGFAELSEPLRELMIA